MCIVMVLIVHILFHVTHGILDKFSVTRDNIMESCHDSWTN